MDKQYTLEQLADFNQAAISRIGLARKEIEEVQVGFNSAYVEWKAQHDATLARLAETVVARFSEVGPALQARIQERLPEERGTIAARRKELDASLIRDRQAQADKLLEAGQQVLAELRRANPEFDAREEEYKARRAKLEKELSALNEQIRRLSGCVVVVFNFGKVSKLDRRRQRVIGQLEQVQQELRNVRQQWDLLQRDKRAEQRQLEEQWQQLTLELAELRSERDYLAEERNREELALHRAARWVLDGLTGPVESPLPDLKAELDRMAELNVKTDEYEAGLGAVASVLSLLDGVAEGMKRFAESVHGLLEEQRLHSAHLPRLKVTIPEQVLAFHSQWDALAQKVRDDGRLAQHPGEFVGLVQPTIERDLSAGSIQAMFEGLGAALTAATKSWRG